MRNQQNINDNYVASLVAQGKKLSAIKYVRECTGCGLKEAKDYVENNFSSPYQSSSNTTSGGCYVATCVYGSYDCPEVWTLRRFRDNTLASTWYGRLFVRIYYAVSPTIVKWFGDTAWFKRLWKKKLDRMVARLNAKGVEDTPYEDINW